MRLMRLAFFGLLAAGTALGGVACSGAPEGPASGSTAGTNGDVRTVSLHVEGMT